ncbi:MAG: TonB-dependent receptor [Spirosoma sp.]|nr:TonB-dependent receptor [Spirosoma sp.]
MPISSPLIFLRTGLTFVFLLTVSIVLGQSLRGSVVDSKNEPLIGVTVRLISLPDSSVRRGVVTDTDGRFRFDNVAVGSYRLRASFVGFSAVEQTARVDTGRTRPLRIVLPETSRQLSEVVVKGKIVSAEQKGDTLQFNADAFKVNRDAQAEDLLKKMPGVDMTGGTIKVQGEAVQEVLVDGKPFFGDDPTIALRNLPAEVIAKIEIFDRQSDQSQFTGVNDGNTTKTINIITRSDKRNGQFGKVYAGAGTDATYNAGGSVNFFDGERRISVIGQSNNINQQNFSSQDLLGVQGSSGGGGQGGRGGRGGGARGGRGGGGRGDAGPTDNFLVGQQNGISTTNSFGINYSDKWGEKLTVRGSYFMNQSGNRNQQSLLRTYYQNSGDSTQTYREQSSDNSSNMNHRLNFRLDYAFDKRNSLLITPRLSFQTNTSTSLTNSDTQLGDALLNQSDNTYSSRNQGYTFNNNLLFRHRFEARGRTISLNVGTALNDKTGLSTLISENDFFGVTPTQQRIDQRTNTTANGYQLSAGVNYTEPFGKGIMQLSYNAGLNHSNADRYTYRLNPASENYDLLDSLLSNRFNNDYLTQRAGLSYSIRTEKLRLSASANLQRADLQSDQLFPRIGSVNRTFTNVLPTVFADYRITDDKRLRFTYRTSTDAPNINQLQNVLNNTNPLQQTIGNPDLKQSYTHALSLRFTKTSIAKANSMVGLLAVNLAQNPIGSSLFIAERAGVVPGVVSSTGKPIFLQQGTQLTRPVNTGNALSSRGFFSFGTPLTFIKTNLNLNTSLTYNQTPSLINGQVNRANSYNLSQGVVLSSNISEKFDFTLSYNYGYSKVVNRFDGPSLQTQRTTAFNTQTVGGSVVWNVWKGMVLRSDVNIQRYAGLSSGFNQRFTLWNASMAQRFLKKDNGELRLSVFDLLNQNTSVSRSFSETYLEDNRSLVLRQYFMLTFTLRQFRS